MLSERFKSSPSLMKKEKSNNSLFEDSKDLPSLKIEEGESSELHNVTGGENHI